MDKHPLTLRIFCKWLEVARPRSHCRYMGLMTQICRAWHRVIEDPHLLSDHIRVMAYDVGTTNMGIWAGHYDPARNFPYVLHYWKVVNLQAANIPSAVFKFCDQTHRKRSWCRFYHCIAIESQFANARMTALSRAMVAHHYTLRLMRNYPDAMRAVQMTSAGGKYKVYKGPPLPLKIGGKRTRYKVNKATSLAHGEALLREAIYDRAFPLSYLPWWLGLSEKRRGDSADAFLLAAYKMNQLHKATTKTKVKHKSWEIEKSKVCLIEYSG